MVNITKKREKKRKKRNKRYIERWKYTRGKWCRRKKKTQGKTRKNVGGKEGRILKARASGVGKKEKRAREEKERERSNSRK